MLISLDKQTCTLFFSWHTPLACEQVVSVEKRGPRLATPSSCNEFTAAQSSPADPQLTPSPPDCLNSEVMESTQKPVNCFET
jgi:hypothetical protein